MGAALLAWNSLLPQLNNLLFLLGGMGIGVLVYAFALVLMKVPELASVLGALRQRLNARKQRPA